MKILHILILLGFSFIGISQNLIDNGDFESYTSCPNEAGQLTNAEPWINSAALTPDYMHSCAQGTDAGVPLNAFGNQMPNSGEGYAGIYTYQNFPDCDVREYITISLTEPLLANTSYALEFHVSLSEQSRYAVSTIGALFTENNSFDIDKYILEADPQIFHIGEALTDTENWMLISGSFTAQGGEQFLTIGNFEEDDSSGLVQVNPIVSDLSYYYIDDVRLDLLSSLEDQEEHLTKLFPNPFENVLNIETSKNTKTEILIYDLSSKLVISKSFTHSVQIDTHNLPAGIYFYEIKNDEGILKRAKLFKQ